jgi:hypothetical protein
MPLSSLQSTAPWSKFESLPQHPSEDYFNDNVNYCLVHQRRITKMSHLRKLVGKFDCGFLQSQAGPVTFRPLLVCNLLVRAWLDKGSSIIWTFSSFLFWGMSHVSFGGFSSIICRFYAFSIQRSSFGVHCMLNFAVYNRGTGC